jgi:hypothetical protein
MRPLDPPKTPLLEVLRQCTVAEQHELAALAGTKRNYLYQLATCRRKSTKLNTAYAISEAVTKMHVKTLGKVPKISVEELATMCPRCVL